MKKIGKYVNGNYQVYIFDDGTKIRVCNDNEFKPEFPESIDFKITNYCELGCPMCHEDSHVNGKHASINELEFLDTLHPYTELAIGGGNPLAHPALISFLKRMRDRNVICNMTVNQVHLMENAGYINSLVELGLIHGLGVSVDECVISNLKEYIKESPNLVLHTIAGLLPLSEWNKIMKEYPDSKILILGFKYKNRGSDYYCDNPNKVVENIRGLESILPELFRNQKIVSFDNLALKQLNVEGLVGQDKWQKYYMGNDGHFTMYIDGVSQTFSKSSVDDKSHCIEPDIKDMFSMIRGGALNDCKYG